jgi:hypothetical protein
VQDGTCYGAIDLQWNKQQRGPVVTSVTASTVSTTSPGQCAQGGAALEVTLAFYSGLPGGLTYPDLPSLLAEIQFQNPTGAGPSGGRSKASFVTNSPPSGASSGTLGAGLCGIVDVAGWSVILSDGAGHSGNVMCVQ